MNVSQFFSLSKKHQCGETYLVLKNNPSVLINILLMLLFVLKLLARRWWCCSVHLCRLPSIYSAAQDIICATSISSHNSVQDWHHKSSCFSYQHLQQITQFLKLNQIVETHDNIHHKFHYVHLHTRTWSSHHGHQKEQILSNVKCIGWTVKSRSQFQITFSFLKHFIQCFFFLNTKSAV